MPNVGVCSETSLKKLVTTPSPTMAPVAWRQIDEGHDVGSCPVAEERRDAPVEVIELIA